MTESPDQLHQSLYQSGLLLISDFRQTLVMELHVENSEKSQLLNALNLLEPTSLDENSLLLLYHDLSYIFTKYFFDFDFGILTPESEFTRTSDTTFFFKDYFLYFSFVSSFYEEPKEFKPELFKEKLSPFLFVSFVHNLIDVSNLAAPSHASNTIEYEMCKQLILNAKQLSQIDTFLILKKDLSTRVSQSLNSSDFKQDEFNAIFQSAFVRTIVYPDSDFKDKNFTNLKKKIRKTLKIKKHDFLEKLDQFSEDRNILSYNTFVHKRYSLFNNSWIYPPEILEDFKPIAELRLNILSKKIGDLMGRENSSKSFGNSLVRIQFPNVESAVAIFHYNRKEYSIQARDRQIEAVFPVFRGQTLQIEYKLNKKIFDKNRMVIESLTETGELRGTVMINKKVSNIIINYTYYQMDQVIPNLSNYLNMNPSSLFDFAVECFIREFIYKNKEEETETNEQDGIITSCESDELLADINNPDSKMFNNQNENNQADSENNKEKLSTKHKLKHKSWRKSKAKTEIIHHDKNKKKRKHKSKDRKKKRAEDLLNGIEEGEDIENHAFNKRVFPVDFWLFLCDLAMKYSLPCSYFFTKIVEKLTDCWCNSQAFVSLYCVMIYSLYYSHNNENSSPEEKKDFQLFLYFAKKNAKTLLANQLAKPELYEKTSITSLVLILSLCLDNNKLSTILEEIFIASQDNIFKSIHKKLKFEKSENECISMGLYTITYSGFQEFDVGPNGLPLCNITPESLIDALKLVSLRCKSISAFYLNQFLPSFLNIEQKSLEDLALITINIADTFTKIYPLPAQQLLAQFVIVYKEVYSVLKEYKLIHPSVLFNTPIINWLTDLSQSAIEETDRSILFDPFEKYSDNVKTSPSLVDLFRFFEQGFSFIKGLHFTRGELENKLTVFFSICASMVSNYIDQILSIVALPFRMINAHKGKFPSWIPDCYFAQRHITVRQMFVIINNLCNIPQYWEKFLQKYVSYCQINESEEEINHIRQIKDPRLKLNEKVLFAYNFIRLDTVYNITELLMPKLWSLGKIGLIRAKLLRDDFSIITFENLLNDVLDIFRNKVASMMEDLQETQFIKCLPHIVRGVEEGVFECLIPFAFSTKAKLLKEMIGKCSAMFQEMLKYINCLFQNNNTIIMKCKEKITFLPYVETHLNFRGKDLDMILQVEKKVQNFDHVILVNMLMQANSVAPLPKPMNESFTFIRLS